MNIFELKCRVANRSEMLSGSADSDSRGFKRIEEQSGTSKALAFKALASLSLL